MAKSGINKVILVGNLGNEPEAKAMPNGNAVSNLSIATSESWNDQTGNKQERTEWHRVVVFGKLAEICNTYLRKGSKVYLEGSLRTRKWQAQDGTDRYSTEIVMSEMQMLDSKGQSNNDREYVANGREQARKAMAEPQRQPEPDFDDDLPFN